MKKQRVITLASKAWDKGVLGIVCSRLVEKYHKPVFLFVVENGMLSGSGRSIDDINIHQLLSSMKDILETFGGHSMAAGLTLKLENYQLFSQKINDFALNNISEDVFMPIEYYDQEVEEEDITPEFVKELSLLEPFGCENPRPKFKITTQNLEIVPLKRLNQHANFKIGKLNLMYYNFVDNLIKISFSRQKSFIFELEPYSTNGTIEAFDGGSFIVEDAYKKLNALEISQISIKGDGNAKFKLYPQSELLNFVGGTTNSVFGTCFVTYSCFYYVEFCKNYNIKDIYHFGIYDENEIGYNTLLLSPKGINWAKNFSKIIFLSPVLDKNFISAINEISEADIYIPLDKAGDDPRKFSGIDLSRETFARIFKAISKCVKGTYNLFDLFDKCDIAGVSFATFYSAVLVFGELGLLNIFHGETISIKINKTIKKELNMSSIYNKLALIKQTHKGEVENIGRIKKNI